MVAADDFGFVVAGTTFAVVAVVDSFVSLPGVVFRIFSSLATDSGCCRFCTAHRGHSPTLNGCSSLCLLWLPLACCWSNFKSLNLSLISHTALAVTMRLGLTGPDSAELPAAISCCWRSCCWCCCMVRFRTLALLDMVVEVVAAAVSQIVTEDVIGGGGGGVAEVVTARNVPGVVAQAGML